VAEMAGVSGVAGVLLFLFFLFAFLLLPICLRMNERRDYARMEFLVEMECVALRVEEVCWGRDMGVWQRGAIFTPKFHPGPPSLAKQSPSTPFGQAGGLWPSSTPLDTPCCTLMGRGCKSVGGIA
jgi:hypothetical protein